MTEEQNKTQTEPQKKKVKFNFLPVIGAVVGAIGGAAVGLVFVFFMELTSATFRTVQDLERTTRLPVLA